MHVELCFGLSIFRLNIRDFDGKDIDLNVHAGFDMENPNPHSTTLSSGNLGLSPEEDSGGS